MNNFKTYQLVLILAPFVFSFAFGLDIYIPIVPQMAQIFNTTSSMVQLTLSLFLFTTGIGQLIIGPLSDQFGRKAIFYSASALFIFGSLGCAFSQDVVQLITARIIASIGACGMLVNSFALVRDLFSNEKSAQMYSFLNGAIGISPTFAPIIGGYLNAYFGWQSVFIFLAFIGFLALFITKQCVRETLEKPLRIKIDQAVFKRYWYLFTHRQFMIYSLIGGFADVVFFGFFLTSPFIIIGLLGVPTHEFGYYFCAFGAVIALGGLLSGKLVERIGIILTMKIGILLMFVGGVSMLGWYYIEALNLCSFLIPMTVACTGAIFLIGGAASAALEPFGKMAGTASAAFGALEFGLSAIGGCVLMLFPITSSVPYGICIILMAIFSLVLFGMRQEAEIEHDLAT